MSDKPIPSLPPLTVKSTRIEVEAVLHLGAKLQAMLAASGAARDAAVLAIDEKYNPVMSRLRADLGQLEKELKMWGKANPAEFGDVKTITFTNGDLAFRNGQPKLGLYSKMNWKKVLDAMIDAGTWEDYIRREPEIKKIELLSAAKGENPMVTAAALKEIGVKVEQDENFSVEFKPVAATSQP